MIWMQMEFRISKLIFRKCIAKKESIPYARPNIVPFKPFKPFVYSVLYRTRIAERIRFEKREAIVCRLPHARTYAAYVFLRMHTI